MDIPAREPLRGSKFSYGVELRVLEMFNTVLTSEGVRLNFCTGGICYEALSRQVFCHSLLFACAITGARPKSFGSYGPNPKHHRSTDFRPEKHVSARVAALVGLSPFTQRRPRLLRLARRASQRLPTEMSLRPARWLPRALPGSQGTPCQGKSPPPTGIQRAV